MTTRLFATIAAACAFAAALAVAAVLHGGGSDPRPAAPPADGPVLRPSASTTARIAALQVAVRNAPDEADGYTLLAAAYLQRVRETGDFGLYTRAEAAIDRALRIAPADPAALVQRASLKLSRHDFSGALVDARRARALAPRVNKPFGVLVDALVELGRYDEAAVALQEMADRRPDLAAYARVSYLRELEGDLDGAAGAMRLAVSAGGAAAENVAYVQSLLGDLEFRRGRLPAARHAYRAALARFPGHVPAEAGLARVEAARGHLGRAITRMRAVVARLPLPEHVIALGELEQAAGRDASASSDFALVRAEQRLLAAGGVNTDVELAIFESDHGSPARGVSLARRAWAAAPSVRSADALGWALTRAGRPRDALPWARRALALGSRDASFLFHAGIAAKAAGEPALATRRLHAALALNPRFSPTRAPQARRALAELGA
jgi:tetratricopeptide (TPR) repeat protein